MTWDFTIIQNIINYLLGVDPLWYFIIVAPAMIIISTILFFIALEINSDLGKFLSKVTLFNLLAVLAAFIFDLMKLF